jgi:hypothetical protein
MSDLLASREPPQVTKSGLGPAMLPGKLRVTDLCESFKEFQYALILRAVSTSGVIVPVTFRP